MHGVLFGSTLLAAFLGGVVALLAPCCVSVMLPAYLATGMRTKRGVVAATGVFAAGVATVIVPIGLGASAIGAAVSGHHRVVFLTGGAAMVIGGLAVLAGWRPRIPMPLGGRGPRGRDGIGPVYGLGLFSGIASSCCAPVLAGVVVLSGAAASFPIALTVALTYVAGMVAPLAMLALLWDRRDWSSSRLLHGREVSLGIGGLRRQIPIGMLASGLLMIGMGALTVVTAFTSSGMSGASGWRLRLSADLQHWSNRLTHALSWLPGWAFLTLLLCVVALLVRHVRSGWPGPQAQSRADLPVAVVSACCPSGPISGATRAPVPSETETVR